MTGKARIAFVIGALITSLAQAQNFPTKPLRIVTSPAGGNSDTIVRMLAAGMPAGLKQPVIVDNRGGGNIPIVAVQNSAADGYTLLYYGSGFWINPMLEGESSDERLRLFTPVSIAVSAPLVVTVHPSLPVKSVKELVALAKARPGALNYGSTSAGSTSHMAAELMKAMAGVDMVRVPYKGGAQVLNALFANEVQVLMSATTGTAQHMASGKIRGLAVTGPKRSALFPDLPTVAEGGLPGFEYGQMTALFVPGKTAPAIVDQLSREIARSINASEVKDKLLNLGVDAEGTTPQEALARIRSEVSRLGKVIKEANIKAEN